MIIKKYATPFVLYDDGGGAIKSSIIKIYISADIFRDNELLLNVVVIAFDHIHDTIACCLHLASLQGIYYRAVQPGWTTT